MSSRDFLGCLQRFIRERGEEWRSEVSNRGLSVVAEVLGLGKDQEGDGGEGFGQGRGKIRIGEEVVKTLTLELRNKSVRVREAVLLELGNIGEEAGSVLEAVVRGLTDGESAIRSVACWTISRLLGSSRGLGLSGNTGRTGNRNSGLNGGFLKKIESKLSELLRDNFWKVRTSACISLGLILTANTPQTQTI